MTCAINSCMYTTFILMALVLIAQASYFVFSVLTQFLCLSLTSLTFLVAFCVALVASLRAIVNWNSQRLRVLALFFVLYAALQVGMFLAEVLGVYGSGFVVWEKGLYVVISFSSCIFLSLLLALAIFLMWRKIIEKEKLCDTAINEAIFNEEAYYKVINRSIIGKNTYTIHATSETAFNFLRDPETLRHMLAQIKHETDYPCEQKRDSFMSEVNQVLANSDTK
eukprot:TRINITY_DN15161_c0_g1_i2.p1 TRINITY_DN15161_c0_g1~~TRINITY_DN15161_c0_g1_i2.p1  ORF type:complete len:223 (+),score=46.32 TRINITY_DN15161_c0_g1_i2:162-830(+)